MQDKIKEIMSLPKEEADKKYHELLKELYEVPVLWTVLHRDLSDIGSAMGNPVILNFNKTGTKVIRLFTQYHYAVDFCDKHPEFTYQGIPLIAKLEKGTNDFNYLFSIAPHMQIQRIYLDDCSIAQILNFGLMDFIHENNINTKISCMVKGPAQPNINLRFNLERFDLFSQEMCNHIINPVISTYFSNDRQIACDYLESAPLIYVLFMCNCFENWVAKNQEKIEGTDEFIAYSKKLLIKRLFEQKYESDILIFFLMKDNAYYFPCAEDTVCMPINNIGLQSYTKIIGQRYKSDINTFFVKSEQLPTMLQIYEAGDIKNIRFLLPYKDSINVVMSIEEIRNILKEI